MEEISVPESLSGERIDRALSLIFDITRTEAIDLLLNGKVQVSGKSKTPTKSYRLTAGEVILIAELPSTNDFVVLPRPDIPLDIVFHDEDIVVVNKAAHQVVHPGSGREDDTLVQALLARFPQISEVGEDPLRPGVVHRLDKGTSGVMVFALSNPAYEKMKTDIASHRYRRIYLAMVEGLLDTNSAVVDAPIGRSDSQPRKMTLKSGGRRAITRFEVLERFERPRDATFVSVELETGRTHQIRVHMASLGHPVLGDHLYGRPDDLLDRPFLHSSNLELAHPITGEEMTFSAALPKDLEIRLHHFRTA
jgi:23S rRNA pseudouridine1911/1915/1917 synthase